MKNRTQQHPVTTTATPPVERGARSPFAYSVSFARDRARWGVWRKEDVQATGNYEEMLINARPPLWSGVEQTRDAAASAARAAAPGASKVLASFFEATRQRLRLREAIVVDAGALAAFVETDLALLEHFRRAGKMGQAFRSDCSERSWRFGPSFWQIRHELRLRVALNPRSPSFSADASAEVIVGFTLRLLEGRPISHEGDRHDAHAREASALFARIGLAEA